MQKKYWLVLVTICATFLTLHFPLEPREEGGRAGGEGGGGPRGGGVGGPRGGGGGGFRGGGAPAVSRGAGLEVPRASVNRTPSMSRAGQRATEVPMQRTRATPSLPSGLPHTGQPMRTPVERVGRPTPSVSRDQINSFFQGSRSRNFNPQLLNQKQQAFRTNLPERQRLSKQNVASVRDRIRRDRPGYRQYFQGNFFVSHHYHPHYYNQYQNWWTPASWFLMANWLSWNNISPIYYQEGYPIYITPDYGDLYPGTAQNYTPPPAATAPTAPQAGGGAVQGDWLPLGVFAVGKNANQAGVSNMFVQLALSKDGEIAGTYYNALTDQTHELEGSIDEMTQQAVWKISDNPNSPIMSTGLFNLSQDETDVTVHFPNGIEQSWLMIRMNE
jgi:hypothetical protein